MPLTFTVEQYPLFRKSFDARPIEATVAFETIDMQELQALDHRTTTWGSTFNVKIDTDHANAAPNTT